MYCERCGNPLPDGAAYCPRCGAPRSQKAPAEAPAMTAAAPAERAARRPGRGKKLAIIIGIFAVCAAAAAAIAAFLLLRASRMPPNGNLYNGGILVTYEGTHLFADNDSAGYNQENYDNSCLKYLELSGGEPVLTNYLRGMYKDMCVFQDEIYCVEMTVPDAMEGYYVMDGLRAYALTRLDLETGEKEVLYDSVEPVSIVGVTESGLYFTAYSDSHSTTTLKHVDLSGAVRTDGIKAVRLVTGNGIFSTPTYGDGVQHTTLDGSSWTMYQSLRGKTITDILFEIDGYLYVCESTAAGDTRILRLDMEEDTYMDISQEVELSAAMGGSVGGCTYAGKHLYFTYSVSDSGYSCVLRTDLSGRKPKILTWIDAGHSSLSFVDRYHLAAIDTWERDIQIVDARKTEG